MLREKIILLVTSAIILLCASIHCSDLVESRLGIPVKSQLVNISNQLLAVTPKVTVINLTWIKNSTRSCDIKVSPENRINQGIQVEILSNGKIIAWSYNLDYGKIVEPRISRWLFFVIDPNSCSSREIARFDFGKPKLDQILTVLPYHDTFDVFTVPSGKCLPCRFNDKGGQIHLPHTLINNEKIVFKPGYLDYEIITLKEKDPTHGYVYKYDRDLKILNPNFDVSSERTFDRKIDSYKLLNGAVEVCWNEGGIKYEPICEHLRYDLKTKLKTTGLISREEEEEEEEESSFFVTVFRPITRIFSLFEMIGGFFFRRILERFLGR